MQDFITQLGVVRARADLVNLKIHQGKTPYAQDWAGLASEIKRILEHSAQMHGNNPHLHAFLQQLFVKMYGGAAHYKDMELPDLLQQAHLQVWLPMWAMAVRPNNSHVELIAKVFCNHLSSAIHDYLRPTQYGNFRVFKGGK